MRHLYYCVLLSMGAYGLYQAVAALSEKKYLKKEAKLSRERVFPDHYPPSVPSRYWACIQLDCFVSCVYYTDNTRMIPFTAYRNSN